MPYIIIEMKQGKLRDGKEQLRSYAHATGAPLAMWSNGILAEVWHRKNPNYFVSIHHLPRANQTIEDIVDQPWTMQTLIDKEAEREREGSKARSLRDLILEMENEVLANAGVDVFEEVFKLVFTKLYDEMSHHRGNHPVLRFRNSNTAAQLKKAIQELFDEAKQKWPGVFLDDEPLTIEWPEGHSYAVVVTAFHGGAVLGTTATEDEAWEIYDQWPKTDCRCGCRGIVTRDGLRLRRGGSPQKILDDFDPIHLIHNTFVQRRGIEPPLSYCRKVTLAQN